MNFLLACFSTVLLALSSSVFALEELNDIDMGAVTGQEGVLISLEYYYNSKAPHESSGLAGKGVNDIGAGNADCTGIASVNCRLALQLENRDFGWLVFKNGHASLEMNRLSLDAALLGDTPNGVSNENKAIALNLGKFLDESGSCLLGGVGVGNCNASYINKLPGVRAHYPQSGGSYDSSSRTISGYTDVLLGVSVEGLAVEYNEPDGTETWTAQPGWQANNFGSFMGFEIADNLSHQAGIAIGGNFYMYGF